MNNGTMRGFTWQTLPAGATYPEMKVRWVQYTGPNITLGSGGVDTIHFIDTDGGPVTVELDGSGIKEGQCIHVAQWGTSSVTLANSDGLLRVAGTATSRAQYSVMTAMLTHSGLNEWLVFGDITV